MVPLSSPFADGLGCFLVNTDTFRLLQKLIGKERKKTDLGLIQIKYFGDF